MTKEEYVGTIEVRGTKVDIGSDDNGQQYFFEFEDCENGGIKSIGCGAYNFDFIEYICYFLDRKGYYYSLYGEQFWKDKIKHIERIRDFQLKVHPDDREFLEEHYESMLYHMRNDDYDIYDFDALYKQIGFER